jgi:(p)ppGpp synthase/HD superfamily hydrolase
MNTRSLFVHKSGSRKDVLGLTMALRATRLQFAGRLPPALRQQLAIETLQIWAPLSFEIGISSYTPELEVQSYVLLFPRSFGSFISWYGAFRPMAKRLLKQIFRVNTQISHFLTEKASTLKSYYFINRNKISGNK